MRNLPFGIELVGDKGTLVFDGKGWHIENGAEVAEKATPFEQEHKHASSTASAIGKRPAADIEEGHRSTRLCHLGNIAYRLGRTLKFDATTETIPGDAEANRSC